MAGTKTAMLCNECGHKFKRTIGAHTYEVRCPNCGGYDTEPTHMYVPKGLLGGI